jgi:hypothetical protein
LSMIRNIDLLRDFLLWDWKKNPNSILSISARPPHIFCVGGQPLVYFLNSIWRLCTVREVFIAENSDGLNYTHFAELDRIICLLGILVSKFSNPYIIKTVFRRPNRSWANIINSVRLRLLLNHMSEGTLS